NDLISSGIDDGLILKRPIRIAEQTIEVRSEQLTRAFHQHLSHGRSNLILQLMVSISQINVHLHGHHFFGQLRQVKGDVLQIEEHSGTHEMIREDSRAYSGLLSCHGRSFPSLGTDVVVTGIVPGDTLQYPIPAYEVHLSAVLDAVRQHSLRVEAIVEIEHVACIAP